MVKNESTLLLRASRSTKCFTVEQGLAVITNNVQINCSCLSHKADASFQFLNKMKVMKKSILIKFLVSNEMSSVKHSNR